MSEDYKLYLIESISEYSKQVCSFRETIATHGMTLPELSLLVAQAHSEKKKAKILGDKLEKLRERQPGSPEALPHSRHTSVDKVLAPLDKKEARLLKKLRQIS